MFSRFLIAVLLLSGQPGFGHEFWIEPESYQVEPGASMTATLRNGQNFEGISLAWFDNRFTRFELATGETLTPVEGRMGDTPALQAIAPGDGLLIVLHETTPSNLTYKEWEKFLAFAEHKDFPTAAAAHTAAGWPKEGFRESYTRHAKALMAVGDGSGQDRAFGLATEFVALTNPYDPQFDGNMRVRVTYQGLPRRDAQVEVFDKGADGTVAVSLTRTDQDGVAVVPVTPGHSYLFDAVVLRASPQAGSSEKAPVWETLWAALTFAVPE
ncbi:DUF4198 domain-containing protein [Roseobacter sp. YSTF-M11]|uniref:DUF4198 domain-containing protein n=1 Tax=Roseobacter insulae TaxID=2859783 RepID=A0A9X1FXI2_9RHOB|nr:DUF4198 domain-containing protein [Roseobacter insulae]MBW4708850.1 DUF4198 domain-containing protein [Roseobacter insulae]